MKRKILLFVLMFASLMKAEQGPTKQELRKQFETEVQNLRLAVAAWGSSRGDDAIDASLRRLFLIACALEKLK